MKKNNIAIILSSGIGSRFGGDNNEFPKQLMKVAGKSLLEHTIERFERNKNIDEIIVVVSKKTKKIQEKIIKNNNFKKIKKIIIGGNTRQESSRFGIFACSERKVGKILIHDAVRPFVSDDIINTMISALDIYDAVDVAIPLSDTIIKVNSGNFIVDIPKRVNFKRGQTPQGFKLKIIKKAHKLAMRENFFEVTDDCGLIKKYNLAKIFVINGSDENIKITYPIDLHIADKLFQLKNLKINISDEKKIKSKLKNKNIVIFGHSSGIGKDIFRICKSSGSKVAGYSLSNDFDITNFKKVFAVIKEFVKKNGKIDILISTPAILLRKKLIDFTLEEIDKQIRVNYFAQVNIVKEAIKNMSKKGGSIALFTSSSYTRGRETYSIYSSTKAAIVNFVQAVSEEVFPQININAICPSRTKTPMRQNNFGKEDPKTLLSSKKVALITLQSCLSGITGQVVNIK